MINNTTNKIAYLDGLRGLAAVIVLVWHFLCVFYPATLNGDPKISHLPFAFDAWLYNSPFSFFYNGDFAVSIFFVLSGYVLTKAYFVKKDKDFLIKRALARYPRLFIPSAVSILFAFVLFQTGAYQVFYLDNGANHIVNYTKIFSFEKPFLHTLSNILFDIFFSDYHTSKILNAVLWTMGIEFKGSLLVLSTALFISEIKHRNILVIVIAVLMTVCIQPDGIYYGAFLIGMLLANSKVKPRSNSWLFSLMVFALYLGGYFENGNSYVLLSHHHFIEGFTTSIRFYHTLGAIAVVYCVLHSVWLQKIFDSNLLRYIGKISFSLYLMHQPIIYSLCSWIVLSKITNYNLLVTVAFVALIILSWAIAHIMTETVDRFAIQASAYFAKAMLNTNRP